MLRRNDSEKFFKTNTLNEKKIINQNFHLIYATTTESS